MRNKPLFILLALALFGLAAVGGYYGPDMLRDYREEKRRAGFLPAVVPQLRADNFARHFNAMLTATEAKSLPDAEFTDIRGKKHRFSDFEGRPTLVNFWATWCMPCVVELPSLGQFADHYKDRINVVAVALEPGKTAAEIARFLETREIGGFAGYLDEGDKVGKALELRGIPTSFLIGSDGLILYRFEGDAEWMSPDAITFFDTFLLQKR